MGKAMDWLCGDGGTLASYLALRVMIAGSAMLSMAFVCIKAEFWWGLGWLLWPAIYVLDVVFRSQTYRQGYAAGAMTVTITMQEALHAGKSDMVIPGPPKMWKHRPYMRESYERLGRLERDRANAPENYAVSKGM